MHLQCLFCLIFRSQSAIFEDLKTDIPKSFPFVFSDTNFEVISGKLEGVYAWIAVNYVLQKFGHGEEGELCYLKFFFLIVMIYSC